MKVVRNLLTSTGKWGDGEGDVTLKSQMAYFFKICETFLSKKRHTEAPSWKNRHTGEKFRRLCQIQSHFRFYVTMEIWLQRFHFASKHFWLANAENIVNSSAIGKKTNWKTQKSFFSAQWDINFGGRVMKLSKKLFPVKLLETVDLVVRKNSINFFWAKPIIFGTVRLPRGHFMR